jgi:hypothetical protein
MCTAEKIVLPDESFGNMDLRLAIIIIIIIIALFDI